MPRAKNKTRRDWESESRAVEDDENDAMQAAREMYPVNAMIFKVYAEEERSCRVIMTAEERRRVIGTKGVAGVSAATASAPEAAYSGGMVPSMAMAWSTVMMSG
jgi:hypothetical protein